MPDFEIEDIEDAYTYYVLILGVPEGIFWHADLPFIHGVVANKSAYDGWAAYMRERETEKA